MIPLKSSYNTIYTESAAVVTKRCYAMQYRLATTLMISSSVIKSKLIELPEIECSSSNVTSSVGPLD